MKQIILTAATASYLTDKIEKHIADGWIPVGGHTVVTTIEQLKYGWDNTHAKTVNQLEYAQSMKKREQNIKIEDVYSPMQKPDFELKYCPVCIQMTNHLNGLCQKCKRNLL